MLSKVKNRCRMHWVHKVQWSCQAVPNLQAINKKTGKIVFDLEINKQTDQKTHTEVFGR